MIRQSESFHAGTFRALLLVFTLTLTSLSACAHAGGRDYGVGYTERGDASWYGPGFHGRLTANGETYDQYGMTAAHKKLPFGSMVKVTRRDNGHSVVVRITDRGPFVRGRIIDLSMEAARQLDSLNDGVVPVKIRVVREQRAAAGTGYAVQLGLFQNAEGARELMTRLSPRIPGLRLVQEEAAGSVRLMTQSYTNYDKASRLARQIRQRFMQDAFVTMVSDPTNQ